MTINADACAGYSAGCTETAELIIQISSWSEWMNGNLLNKKNSLILHPQTSLFKDVSPPGFGYVAHSGLMGLIFLIKLEWLLSN